MKYECEFYFVKAIMKYERESFRAEYNNGNQLNPGFN